MADFSTHLVGATAMCSFAAIVVAKALDLPGTETLALVAAGIAGGVLPDIDLERATPTRILFTVLGFVGALTWLFANVGRFGALELWAAGFALYLTIRWPLAWLFGKFTVHRGSLHSLAAAVMCGVLTTVFAWRVCGATPRLAWLAGGFGTLGYLVHLSLDEFYSVDFSGARIRRSFGTALKPLDLRRPWGSFAVVVVTLSGWFFTPPGADAITAAHTLHASLIDPRLRSELLLQRLPWPARPPALP